MSEQYSIERDILSHTQNEYIVSALGCAAVFGADDHAYNVMTSEEIAEKRAERLAREAGDFSAEA